MPENTPPTPATTLFDTSPSGPAPCSYNECYAGHRWPPVIAAAQCPGCGSPFMAIQKVNCPYCNEPCVRTVLRSDFVPRGAGTASRCNGGDVQGESLDLEMQRQQWQEVTQAGPVLFEERRNKERCAETQNGN